MQASLKKKVLLIVKEVANRRGALKELAETLDIPYHMLWRFARGKVEIIDADHCQRVYEHLTGKELDIR